MYECKNFLLVLFIYLVGCVTLVGCKPSGESQPAEINVSTTVENEAGASNGPPPPLIVDLSEPLLLDDPNEEQLTAALTQAATENMACFVCHGNYRAEFLTERHATANVGCVNCHGDSFAHCNDENNTTPPEIMYAAEKIDPFCQSCHDAHDIPAKTIIARWIKQKAKKSDATCEGCHKEDDIPLAKVVALWKELGVLKSDPATIVCTDCHGDHRMKVRTVVWDKETGKLLRTNKGD